jgi:uncharacterized protein YgiB involved in biofilm formation
MHSVSDPSSPNVSDNDERISGQTQSNTTGSAFKRSRKVALVLMIPTASLWLAGCAEEPEITQVFASAEQCAAFSNPPEACAAEFAKAKELHQQIAPKYLTLNDCENDFGAGNCEIGQQNDNASSSSFMPMMMGFMAGQMLGNMQSSHKKYAYTQPLYKSKDDKQNYRTAHNYPVASSAGFTSVRPSAVQIKPAGVVKRGGFGAQAAARSSSVKAGSMGS